MNMKKSIALKLILVVVVGLIIQGLITSVFFYWRLSSFSKEQSQQQREEFYSKKKDNLRDLVQLAYSTAETYYNRSQDIESLKQAKKEDLKRVIDTVTNQVEELYDEYSRVVGDAEARERIIEVVKYARFDGNNYIWINDMLPRMVMHPIKPSLNGNDLRNFKDPEGTKLFVEMVEVCKEKGEGMVTYMWPKPGEEEAKPKVSYVKLIPKLNWVLGTGAWIEDITSSMQKEAMEQISKMRRQDGNYFWINDTGLPYPKMVMHAAKPSLDGKVLDNEVFNCATHMQAGAEGEQKEIPGKDKNLFQAMVEVAKAEGEGFVIYQWPKPKDAGGMTEETFPKLSYVKLFKPWGWVIGMGEYVDEIEANVKASQEELRSTVTTMITIGALLILLLVAALVTLMVVFFNRELRKPLNKLVEYATHVTKGEFDHDIKGDFKGEMSILKGSMVEMVSSLKTMISEVEDKSRQAEEEAERAKEATEQAEEAKEQAMKARQQGMLEAANLLEEIVNNLIETAGELQSQIEQTTKGADIQSGRISETATSMEEMNATTLEVAKNASLSAEGSESAKSKARDGATVVENAVRAITKVQEQSESMKQDMSELGDQTEAIGNIMNVISDIADQTNLLALNAAIEAARAGEAGRGFAVVADEVRKLAEKTMGATKEVEQAIHSIQDGAKKNIEGMDQASETISEATELAKQSGASLQEIVSLVEAAADQVRNIATAAEEQSAASEEINRAIEEVNRIAGETSESQTMSTQAMQEVSSLIERLQDLINKLKTE